MRSRLFATLALLLLAGCATVVALRFEDVYGPADPARFDAPRPAPAGATSFRKDVRPILESRCVVCHSCYDAPCQLNLASRDGILRGANPERVYANRIKEAAPSRLFIDALLPSEWRARGFHPVLNERRSDPQADLAASLLWRVLEQKARHPLPDTPILGKEFDFSLDAPQQCAKIEHFDAWEKASPLAGMPYGLPGLSAAERDTIRRWIVAGAPADPPLELPRDIAAQVTGWEDFLNREGLREQLAARYIFEHVFLAHLHFGADRSHDGRPYWFRLIRSSTPPGQPAVPIASRQPFDAPGRAFWYRLVHHDETIVAKTHLPLRLDAARMQRWRELLVDGLPPLATLPPYSANPFKTFRDIPVDRRYRFMLDEAAFYVGGFIKGPVCRGQVALNVINDRFWVFFAEPSTHDASTDEFVATEAGNLRMPAEDVDATPLVSWLTYRKLEGRYLDARAKYLKNRFAAPGSLDLGIVWAGEGRNPNAALTVFRHFDSATVMQGMVGDPPKTAWLLTYTLLERIHYLLVAGFDVFGNIGHQLNSRLYMDFLRMEGETNFLALLPKSARLPVVEHWYRGASGTIREKFYDEHRQYAVESGVRFKATGHGGRPAEPLALLGELHGKLEAGLAPVRPAGIRLADRAPGAIAQALQGLETMRGPGLALMPETAFLRIDRTDGPPVDVTILRNSAHSNISYFFAERWTRLPEEDTLTVVPGFIGPYPNAFYRVDAGRIDGFVRAVEGLRGPDDYRALANRFSVRRTSASFWGHVDALQAAATAGNPLGAGVTDLSRIENR
jgi:hypothetical protein